VPEGRREERGERGPEARFLAGRRDPQVDVVTEPFVGVFVPVVQVGARVLGQLDADRIDVFEMVCQIALSVNTKAFDGENFCLKRS
jgi:hypothetical protein